MPEKRTREMAGKGREHIVGSAERVWEGRDYCFSNVSLESSGDGNSRRWKDDRKWANTAASEVLDDRNTISEEKAAQRYG